MYETSLRSGAGVGATETAPSSFTARLQPDHIRTLGDVTRHHAGQRPEKTASWFEGRETSYAELDERVNRIAQALLATGLAKNDRVVYAGRNSDRYFELLFGCAKAGLVLVPASWRLAPPELAYIIADCDAKMVFADDATANSVASVVPDLPIVPVIIAMERATAGWLTFTQWYETFPADDPQLPMAETDAVLQLYTSGTTGQPKGAQLSHASLCSAFFMPQAGDEPWARWSDEDVSLVALPVAHISGTGSGYLGYCAGALNVITSEFNPALALQALTQHRVSKLFIVPAAIQMLLNVPGVRHADFSCLNYMLYGASPIPLDLLREAVAVFGCGFCQLYGMTETTGPIAYLPPEDHESDGNLRMRSAGKPYAHVELRVRKTDGTLAASGETGEIETRSALNMLGYWKLAEATATTLDGDGWLSTGDAGYLDDDGYLFIMDRIKEMIISGGENIYPAEVESAVFGHPDVIDVAVIGIPDATWGEAVKAIIVPRPGTTPDRASIIAFAKERVASFKAPKSIDFIDAIPRNPSGKILRRVLREPFWVNHDRQVN